MRPTARPWRGTGFLTLGSLLLFGVSTFGAEDPSLSKQLTDLGRQALAQGSTPTARTFFQKALQLDPTNQAAARELEELKPAGDSVVRVAMQDPATTPPAPAADPPAAKITRRYPGDPGADPGGGKPRPAAVDQRRRATARRRPRADERADSPRPP